MTGARGPQAAGTAVADSDAAGAVLAAAFANDPVWR